ncbi:hypothetical protein SAICODRAFT_36452 [Saitoella complicata NRRL Y-17804]|uniref:uncharacterized protein n=1 Tax=Saitoella complicata (strain BCRC 22490 / CBS 7301 / JCM 7358 / NBRC 10748 / NRRL Y-17804) TaxID=698492 RepID=UPI000867446B|nr:uncharacterized protein SAICODRAFT_36452 [Saitoella complicata NRRL Y-17804]ODQ51410.1 hypothetical protein SAICODRAFT_36452 [Saitoella complicata NRRL Y-17804]
MDKDTDDSDDEMEDADVSSEDAPVDDNDASSEAILDLSEERDVAAACSDADAEEADSSAEDTDEATATAEEEALANDVAAASVLDDVVTEPGAVCKAGTTVDESVDEVSELLLEVSVVRPELVLLSEGAPSALTDEDGPVSEVKLVSAVVEGSCVVNISFVGVFVAAVSEEAASVGVAKVVESATMVVLGEVVSIVDVPSVLVLTLVKLLAVLLGDMLLEDVLVTNREELSVYESNEDGAEVSDADVTETVVDFGGVVSAGAAVKLVDVKDDAARVAEVVVAPVMTRDFVVDEPEVEGVTGTSAAVVVMTDDDDVSGVPDAVNELVAELPVEGPLSVLCSTDDVSVVTEGLPVVGVSVEDAVVCSAEVSVPIDVADVAGGVAVSIRVEGDTALGVVETNKLVVTSVFVDVVSETDGLEESTVPVAVRSPRDAEVMDVTPSVLESTELTVGDAVASDTADVVCSCKLSCDVAVEPASVSVSEEDTAGTVVSSVDDCEMLSECVAAVFKAAVVETE